MLVKFWLNGGACRGYADQRKSVASLVPRKQSPSNAGRVRLTSQSSRPIIMIRSSIILASRRIHIILHSSLRLKQYQRRRQWPVNVGRFREEAGEVRFGVGLAIAVVRCQELSAAQLLKHEVNAKVQWTRKHKHNEVSRRCDLISALTINTLRPSWSSPPSYTPGV